MKNMLTFLFLGAISSASMATDTLSKKIIQVNVVEYQGNPQVIVKLQGGVQSVNCTDKTAYVRSLNDEIGKHFLAMSLTALAADKLVDVLGTGACGAFNGEIMKEIRLFQ